jgi:hypothetical protein
MVDEAVRENTSQRHDEAMTQPNPPPSVGVRVSRADVDDRAPERIGECLARGETDQVRILVVWPAGIGGAGAILDAAIRVSKGYTAVRAVDAPAVRDVLRDTLASFAKCRSAPSSVRKSTNGCPLTSHS